MLGESLKLSRNYRGQAFEVFSTGENDFDVVATFKNACPKIVLRVGDTNFIPFDAAAFIIEVKQTLNKENLAKDLEKLGKLISFDCSGRFGISFTGQFSIDRPIKTLLYYESSVAGDTVVKMLLDNVKSWDLLLDFSNDVVIGNAALPIVKANMGADKLLGVFASHSLLNYILLTQSSITLAPVTETMRVFLSLLRLASKKT